MLEDEHPDAAPTPGGERSLDLSVSSVVDPPPSTPTEPPTPTLTGGRDPQTVFQPSSDQTDPGDRSTAVPTDEGAPTRTPDGHGDDGPVLLDGGGGPTPTPTPDQPTSAAVLTVASPASFVDIVPGTSGVVTTTATLSGDPADLWLAAIGTDDGENGLAEPEAAVGDDSAAGELAAALRVRLVVDGTTLYEGALAGLDVPGALVASCVTGDVPLRIAWHLPETVGNEVQTDAARVVVTFGATDCGAATPFAA
jgi:hypothetical protein